MNSLSYKIGLGYFIIILMNLFIATFALFNIYQMKAPIDQILSENYQNIRASEEMKSVINQAGINQLNMLENENLVEKNKLENNLHLFDQWHEQARLKISIPQELLILDSLSQLFNLYKFKTDSLNDKIIPFRSKSESFHYHHNIIVPIVTQLNSLCNSLKHVNEQAIFNAHNKANAISFQANLFISAFSLIAILFSIIAGVYLTKRILKPVKETTETVRKIRAGQINQKIAITTNDEIAELGIEFNRMTKRLADYEKININKIIYEKKKTEAIISELPVCIIITDNENKISLLNEAAQKFFMIKNENWKNQKIDKVFSQKEILELFTLEKSSAHQPVISLKSNNQETFHLVKQINIHNPEENIIGTVTILQNVTTFKKLDILKSDFMATISHEFKTPLTSINMAIDILLKEVTGKLNSQQKELLSNAKDDCIRLKDFSRELLHLSKLESGKRLPEYSEINIETLLKYSLQPLQNSLKAKSINLFQNISSDILNFKADFKMISQVITNLVENAIYHSEKNNTINIEVSKINTTVQFCISDNGPGIPNEDKNTIFDKFFQVDTSKKYSNENIGLGLTISREVVKLHKGKIWVESVLGKGSNFYFQIPINL